MLFNRSSACILIVVLLSSGRAPGGAEVYGDCNSDPNCDIHGSGNKAVANANYGACVNCAYGDGFVKEAETQSDDKLRAIFYSAALLVYSDAIDQSTGAGTSGNVADLSFSGRPDPRTPSIFLPRANSGFSSTLAKFQALGYRYDKVTGLFSVPGYPKPIPRSDLFAAQVKGIPDGGLKEFGLSDEQTATVKNKLSNIGNVADTSSCSYLRNSSNRQLASTPPTQASAPLGSSPTPPNSPTQGPLPPVSVEGLSVNYGGEKIGVAGDNLFNMMRRSYDAERRRGGFLGEP